MKRHTLLIYAALLTVIGSLLPLSTRAQASQDALYIYRNDGGFNAFFFGDIDRFEYSRIDTLGVEHDDYVTQEVWALDTCYRIPISAIDSVAFVTPETVYKSDVAHTIESDLWNYIVSGDTLQFILAANTPANLIPKEGDKVVKTHLTKEMPYSLFAQVTSVTEGSDGIVVGYENISPGNIFEQYVGKAVLKTEDEAFARADRNAIYNTDVDLTGLKLDSIRVYGGNWSASYDTDWTLPSVTWTGNPDELGTMLSAKMPTGDILINGNGKSTLKLIPKLNVRAFYAVSPTGEHSVITMRCELATDLKLKGNMTFTLRGDAPLIPVSAPFALGEVPFLINATLGLTSGVTGAGEVDLAFTTRSSVYVSTQKFCNWLYKGMSYFTPSVKSGSTSLRVTPIDHSSQTVALGKLSGQVGGFLSVGVSNICKIDQFNVRADLVYKNETKVDDIPTLSTSLPTPPNTADYQILGRQGSFKEAIAISSKLVPSIGFGNLRLSLVKTISTDDLGAIVGSVLPPAKRHSAEYDADSKSLNIKMRYEGVSPYGVTTGMALYKDSLLTDSYFSPNYYGRFGENLSASFTNLKDGKYAYYPAYSVLGMKYLGEPKAYAVVGTLSLSVEPQELEFTKEGGTKKAKCTTTIFDQTELHHGEGFGEWWTATLDGDELTVTTTPCKDGEADVRESTVTVVASVKDTDPLVRDSVVVTVRQLSLTSFSVSPDTLTLSGYSEDFKDGLLASAFTARYLTTAKGTTAKSNSQWLTVDEKPANITAEASFNAARHNIYVTPNTSFDNKRVGIITVELTKDDGTTEQKTVCVIQEPMKPTMEVSPDNVVLRAESEEGAKYSDTVTVTLTSNLFDESVAPFIEKQDVAYKAEWLKVSIKGHTIEIYAEANPVEENRSDSVVYTITMKGGGTLSRTIKVTQMKKESSAPFTFSTDEIRFPEEGGEKTVTIIGDNVESILEVDCSSTGWLGAGAMGKIITLTAKPNTEVEERMWTVYVTVKLKDGSKVKNYFSVYQDGKSATGLPEISGVSFSAYINSRTEYSDGGVSQGWGTESMNVNAEEHEIKTAKSGSNGMYVKCKYIYNPEDGATETYELSFDIDDIKGIESKTAVISNISFERSYTSSERENHVELGITNLPMFTMYDNLWKGSANDGIGFTYHGKEVTTGWTSSTTFVEDPDNNAEITIYFK